MSRHRTVVYAIAAGLVLYGGEKTAPAQERASGMAPTNIQAATRLQRNGST